ncbi:ATP-dependent RecD-like DNA helicase [Caloramator mitchellensis]|uniref:ATP-dependent RecD-like DNA helicase n=1 Tax=Caloramator mitchellensis TaxID=908809 RepID=A0A0R3K1I6_CALMK|nr:PRK06851 family protein [Caloramator mitchellensis]KRQ87116.1 ATP-dependent RecD-like DNA helicase [Caloramator mitchellensis]
MVKSRYYLASANTSAGFVNYFDYVLRDAQRVYIIKGGPGTGKSTFMRLIGEDLLKEGMSVDFVYCSADKDSLDAIVVNDLNVVIVDGTAPHVIDPKYPGAVERLLDFGEYWDIDYLRSRKEIIKFYIDEIENQYKSFFKHMKNAKGIHDKWEKEYLKGMDFKKADEITEKLINEVVRGRTHKKSKEWHRFAGAMTPQGQVCFYENLTQDIKNRYIVKGRPGTGKSTMTKKIAQAALNSGYDVEFYHCAFDPSSIDMIVIRELDFALLDGTAPHVFDPHGNDKLVDMFECINTEIVHEDKEPIKAIEQEYAEEIGKAKKIYSNIKQLHDELEKYYINAMDFNNVNALRIRITKTLLEMYKVIK